MVPRAMVLNPNKFDNPAQTSNNFLIPNNISKPGVNPNLIHHHHHSFDQNTASAPQIQNAIRKGGTIDKGSDFQISKNFAVGTGGESGVVKKSGFIKNEVKPGTNISEGSGSKKVVEFKTENEPEFAPEGK